MNYDKRNLSYQKLHIYQNEQMSIVIQHDGIFFIIVAHFYRDFCSF
jgi:hypothetical protein